MGVHKGNQVTFPVGQGHLAYFHGGHGVRGGTFLTAAGREHHTGQRYYGEQNRENFIW